MMDQHFTDDLDARLDDFAAVIAIYIRLTTEAIVVSFSLSIVFLFLRITPELLK